ncbi:MAG TPA: Lrp/AsnC ligand binding domain-containing protein [Nitrosopumilaceae archaeon]|nr:Lrp/AsnC ligand binding domain-containing protein [Nitrosopumilaceae archaeon]
MIQAYVLLNCDMGTEESIIQRLKDVNLVKEVYGTFGAYDVLAKLESQSSEELNNVITTKIRHLENIRSTTTLLTVEGQG